MFNPFKKKQEKKIEENIPVETEHPKEGIRDQLKEINKRLEAIAPKPKESKPYKLSWKARSNQKKIAKSKDKVMVLDLRVNRTAWFERHDIKNGFLVKDGKFYNSAQWFVYLLEGKTPLIIIKDWDINPIGTKDYDDAIKEGRKVDAEEVFIRGLEQIDSEPTKKIGGMTWIWIIIGGAILAYVLFSGQGKK